MTQQKGPTKQQTVSAVGSINKLIAKKKSEYDLFERFRYGGFTNQDLQIVQLTRQDITQEFKKKLKSVSDVLRRDLEILRNAAILLNREYPDDDDED